MASFGTKSPLFVKLWDGTHGVVVNNMYGTYCRLPIEPYHNKDYPSLLEQRELLSSQAAGTVDVGLDNIPKELQADAMEVIMKTYIGACEASMTIGSDPEVFCVGPTGRLIPAFTFLKSKEEDPDVYWDGFQAEFTTKVESCCAWFTDEVHDKLNLLRSKLLQKNPGAKLSLKTGVKLGLRTRAEAADEHIALGCKPSLNAYGAAPLNTMDSRMQPYRFAGYHMHFSLPYCGFKIPKETYVKTLDKILGVLSVSLFQGLENPHRREQYGRAGEYRTPGYGIEWRVLSSVVLSHPAVHHMVWDIARQAIRLTQNKFEYFWQASEDEVQQAINGYDVKLAQEIINRNERMLRAMLSFWARTPQTMDIALDMVYKGIGSAVKNPEDIEGNWLLGKDTWLTHSKAPGCQLNTFLIMIAKQQTEKAKLATA